MERSKVMVMERRMVIERARVEEAFEIDLLTCILANGGGGIRTLETLTGLPVFKTGTFNHSATPPVSASIAGGAF